jgi:hypothetical protein
LACTFIPYITSDDKPSCRRRCAGPPPPLPPPRTPRLLRVWPLDFRSYLLEAEHDAPASAAALSPCGLRVAVGCEDGALGVLDLGARRYATAVRSHCGCVNAAVAHPDRWGEAPGVVGLLLVSGGRAGSGGARVQGRSALVQARHVWLSGCFRF